MVPVALQVEMLNMLHGAKNVYQLNNQNIILELTVQNN